MSIDIKEIAQKLLSELGSQAEMSRGMILGVTVLYERIKAAVETEESSSEEGSSTSDQPVVQETEAAGTI